MASKYHVNVKKKCYVDGRIWSSSIKSTKKREDSKSGMKKFPKIIKMWEHAYFWNLNKNAAENTAEYRS